MHIKPKLYSGQIQKISALKT